MVTGTNTVLSTQQRVWLERAERLSLGGLRRGELALDLLRDPSPGWPEVLVQMLDKVTGRDDTAPDLDATFAAWDTRVRSAWYALVLENEKLAASWRTLPEPMRGMAPRVIRFRVRRRRALAALDEQAHSLFGVGSGRLASREHDYWGDRRRKATEARKARHGAT